MPSGNLKDSRSLQRKFTRNHVGVFAHFWRKPSTFQYVPIQTKRTARRKNFQSLSVRKCLQHIQLLERLATEELRPAQHFGTPETRSVQNPQPVLGSLSAQPVRDQALNFVPPLESSRGVFDLRQLRNSQQRAERWKMRHCQRQIAVRIAKCSAPWRPSSVVHERGEHFELKVQQRFQQADLHKPPSSRN